MRIASITIARGGSRRLPGKNTMPFAGRPLVAHKAWQLAQCQSIDEVVVGSDSEDILTAARAEGATVLHRAPEFCDEQSRPLNDVVVDMVSRVQADVIVWAHCTSPCINPETYDAAIEAFLGFGRDGDSLVSVTEVRGHVWFRGRPVNYTPYQWARTEAEEHQVVAEVPPVFFQNGAIFIASRSDMLKWRYLFGRGARLLETDPQESVDVDTKADMERAIAAYSEKAAARPRLVA